MGLGQEAVSELLVGDDEERGVGEGNSLQGVEEEMAIGGQTVPALAD